MESEESDKTWCSGGNTDFIPSFYRYSNICFIQDSQDQLRRESFTNKAISFLGLIHFYPENTEGIKQLVAA